MRNFQNFNLESVNRVKIYLIIVIFVNSDLLREVIATLNNVEVYINKPILATEIQLPN